MVGWSHFAWIFILLFSHSILKRFVCQGMILFTPVNDFLCLENFLICIKGLMLMCFSHHMKQIILNVTSSLHHSLTFQAALSIYIDVNMHINIPLHLVLQAGSSATSFLSCLHVISSPSCTIITECQSINSCGYHGKQILTCHTSNSICSWLFQILCS